MKTRVLEDFLLWMFFTIDLSENFRSCFDENRWSQVEYLFVEEKSEMDFVFLAKNCEICRKSEEVRRTLCRNRFLELKHFSLCLSSTFN